MATEHDVSGPAAPAPTPVPSSTPGKGTDSYAIASFVTALLGFLPLPLAFSLIAFSRIRHDPGRRGRGFAVAGLWISAAWIGITVALVVLLLGRIVNHRNADDYTGTKREIAVVVDQFEDATERGGDAICALLTRALRRDVAEDNGTCAAAFTTSDGLFAMMDATEITLTGAGSGPRHRGGGGDAAGAPLPPRARPLADRRDGRAVNRLRRDQACRASPLSATSSA